MTVLDNISLVFNQQYIYFNELGDKNNLSNIKTLLQYVNKLKICNNNEDKITYCKIVTSWYNLYNSSKVEWTTVYDKL